MGRNGSGFRVKLLPGARLLTPNLELKNPELRVKGVWK